MGIGGERGAGRGSRACRRGPGPGPWPLPAARRPVAVWPPRPGAPSEAGACAGLRPSSPAALTPFLFHVFAHPVGAGGNAVIPLSRSK